ncbi:hypothetical protein [Hymenobacter sp. DG01]|uniref:hypothetical protein n=1 Tax=Hymenobacter sp. DG01 TaxID=2584940 RepID=UPI00111E1045|nr:hypothetical protein [Hymenobacter sp. DG01]
MAAPTPPSAENSATYPNRALLWVLGVMLIFGFLIFGLYQDARLRKQGVARRALVVRNRLDHSTHVLTLRYCYGPDTLQAEHAENHRRRVQELRPGDSVTVRFWANAPRRVEVETP